MMYSKIGNVEITINDKEDEFIEGLLQSLLHSYHIRLEASIKGSDFIFDCVRTQSNMKCHRTNFKLGGS